MKLLTISIARSIWLFNLNDLNPRGKKIGPSSISHLVETYRFAQYPKTSEEMDENKGMHFMDGTFNLKSGEAITVNFKVFAFGVAAETRSSTKDSDAFITEVLEWISKEYDLPSIDQILRSTAYYSEMHLRSEHTLSLLNPKLERITQKLNSNVKGHGEMVYQPAGITFWNNPSLNQAFPFKFERVDGMGFAEQRYFSAAPLETEIHLDILNDLESILTVG